MQFIFNRLFIKASGLLLLKLLASSVSLVFYYYLAKKFSVTQFGLFSLAMSCLIFASTIAKQGLEQAVVRFFALNLKNSVIKLYRFLVLYSGVSACIIALLITFFAQSIAANLFEKPKLSVLLTYVALFVLGQTWLAINSSVLKGRGKATSSLLLTGVITFTVTLILFFYQPPLSAEIALQQFGVGVFVACLLSFIIVFFNFYNRKSKSKKSNDSDLVLSTEQIYPLIQFKQLLSVSRSLFLISMTALASQQLGTLILASYVSLEQIALFTFALKITLLISYPLIVINSITAPKYAQLYQKKDLIKFKLLAISTTKMLLFVASVGIFILFIFLEPLVRFFNLDYLQAIPLIKILAIGQWFNLATGSVVSMLVMTGFERVYRNSAIFLTTISVVLLLVFIPLYGVVAAAWITSVTMAIKNVVSLYYVNKLIYSKVVALK